MLWQPVDLLIVGQHLVFELGRTNEPTLARVLDQRIVIGSPAKRIVVQVLLLKVQQPAFLQFSNHRFVGVFDPHPFKVGHQLGKHPVGRNGTEQFGPLATFILSLLFDQQLIVDFAKRWSLVDRTTTALGRHKIGTGDSPIQMLFSAIAKRTLLVAVILVEIIERRGIPFTDQFRTGKCILDRQLTL